MPDINEVSQAIKKLADDIGYAFFPGSGGPRKDIKGNDFEYVLNGALQSQKGGNRPLLHIVIAIKLDHFRVTFGTNDPKKANDLNQLLDIIKKWLLNIEK